MVATQNTIPVELKPIYDRIVVRFLERVIEDDSKEYRKDWNYYSKWIHTSHIANDLSISSEIARRKLSKLEELGLVIADRHPHFICWAAKHIKGFKQHQFLDYYEKI